MTQARSLQRHGMDFLHQVEELAKHAHGNQQRKFEPGPYIIHLKRVKDICAAYTDDQAILAAALLHDVLEDTAVTSIALLEELNKIASPELAKRVQDLVVDLTDIYIKDNYPKWNRKKRKQKEAERLSQVSPDAQTIKYADIIDNSQTIADAEGDFARVYLREGRILLDVMQKGLPALRTKAIETVRKCADALHH
jgi:(p)ppGpp synthase/HD superfamily hydrolase